MSGQRNGIPACERSRMANAGMNLPHAGKAGLGNDAGTYLRGPCGPQ